VLSQRAIQLFDQLTADVGIRTVERAAGRVPVTAAAEPVGDAVHVDVAFRPQADAEVPGSTSLKNATA
jgi:hypothetical protein